MKVQWKAYLGAGMLLLSDMGRVLASIVEDTSGTHDALCGASNAAANERRYGDGATEGPSQRPATCFTLALAKHGLGRRDIHPCVNLFKGVRVARRRRRCVLDGAAGRAGASRRCAPRWR